MEICIKYLPMIHNKIIINKLELVITVAYFYYNTQIASIISYEKEGLMFEFSISLVKN